MSHLNIIRAWKDEHYRASLTNAERNLLPDNPAGFIDLTDADLQAAAGGRPPDWTKFSLCSLGCPTTTNPYVCY
jgi:mersacidin/lichenicidin family type 2 lantibiotic